MDADLTLWRRVIFISIGVLLVFAVLVVLYFWYQSYRLNNATNAYRNDILVPVTEQRKVAQQKVIQSITAPAPTSTASASQTVKAPAVLTAPPQKTKTVNNPQQQAIINSLTAPAK